jgi:hypothetical protein
LWSGIVEIGIPEAVFFGVTGAAVLKYFNVLQGGKAIANLSGV